MRIREKQKKEKMSVIATVEDEDANTFDFGKVIDEDTQLMTNDEVFYYLEMSKSINKTLE